MRYHLLWITLYVLLLNACQETVVMMTPQKRPVASHNPLSIKAEQYFWKTLHAGRYQDIPRANYLLTAAYLKNPNDPKITAHIGFLHIWRLTERQRIPKTPLIINEGFVSETYFRQATDLDPQSPIYQGFLGDTELVNGQITHNKRKEVAGYFKLQHAITMWPAFNYFTAGYPMSTLPYDSEHYKEALEWQWKTLDICAKTKVSRHNPDFSPYMKYETKVGPERACWNSWAAPHNFEGFFMNMGDMLVKLGDWKTAIVIYQNAKLSQTYHRWPYRHMLEKRIREAKQNIRYYRDATQPRAHAMMLNSGYGCMACHQR
jgi:tetratricopeptide (TPR) repeat protein